MKITLTLLDENGMRYAGTHHYPIEIDDMLLSLVEKEGGLSGKSDFIARELIPYIEHMLSMER